VEVTHSQKLFQTLVWGRERTEADIEHKKTG
jgi:hypothetical protein